MRNVRIIYEPHVHLTSSFHMQTNYYQAVQAHFHLDLLNCSGLLFCFFVILYIKRDLF